MKTLVLAVAALAAGLPTRAWAEPRSYKQLFAPQVRAPLGRPPARLVSARAPVASVPAGAWVATDGVPGNGGWEAQHPSPSSPAIAALDIGRGPTRLLLWWQASGNPNYEDTTYGGPGSYRIEVSADSSNGFDGSWTTVVAVPDNAVMNRAHAFGFVGQRWVRLVLTGASPRTYQYGVQLDTIAVHDLSRGNDDTWLFVGDSIAAEVFRGASFEPSFPARVKRWAAAYTPPALVAGVGGFQTGDLLARLPQWLAWNPDLHRWAISIGTNNACSQPYEVDAFRRDLEALVQQLLAAGKAPVLARIAWRTDKDVTPLNVALDAVVAKYGLLPGPDLYAHFKANPGQLRDGLHPTLEGGREIHRLWAEAMRGLYPGADLRPRPRRQLPTP